MQNLDETVNQEARADVKRVLIVDDMRINLMVLAAKVKRLQFLCEVADSAFRALELMPIFKPDILLTDLWMPEMNGDMLAKCIRKMPDYQDIPIYVVTAEASNSTEFDMSVFTGMIQKPIDDGRLQEVLFSILPQE